MDAITATQIAQCYLPRRWHYHYSRAKLRMDPLYAGVCQALRDTCAPVLDLGCGIGLLAHCLRAQQLSMPYVGLDSDADKIALATRSTLHLDQVQFAVMDLTQPPLAQRGSVVLLDVLQYLPPPAQLKLLDDACANLDANGKLIVRSGLADAGWRSKITYSADLLGRAVRWMNTSPQRYPQRSTFIEVCTRHGLQPTFQPWWGRTPFNNWLIVATRICSSGQ